MSSYAHLSTACGGIRRRVLVVWPHGTPMPLDWPVCHDRSMRRLHGAVQG